VLRCEDRKILDSYLNALIRGLSSSCASPDLAQADREHRHFALHDFTYHVQAYSNPACPKMWLLVDGPDLGVGYLASPAVDDA
jgi:hypothetical protein